MSIFIPEVHTLLTRALKTHHDVAIILDAY